MLTKGSQVIYYLILISSFKTYLKFDLGVFFFFLCCDLKESLNSLSEINSATDELLQHEYIFHLSSYIASKQLTLTTTLTTIQLAK